MPVSKSRRKKNGKPVQKKHKIAISAIYLEKSGIDEVKELFDKAQLKCEMKLGTGLCTFDDAALFRDCLNISTWCLIYLDRVLKELNDEWWNANQPVYDAAREAFHTFYARGNAQGGNRDESVRYVATGTELTAIKDGLVLAGQIVDEMLENRPQIFLSLYMGMKKFLKGRGTGRLQFTAGELEKAIRKYTRG